MDVRVVFIVVLIIASGVAMGYGFFAVMWRSMSMANARDKQLKQILELAELDPAGPVRDRLAEHALRRQRWGAIGGGIGFGSISAGLLLAEGIVDGAGGDLIGTSIGALGITGGWLGAAVAQSLGALRWLRRPQPGVRVSTLQPHGMADYLNRRELTVEVGLAVVGWVSVTIAVIAAVGTPSWSWLGEPFPVGGLALAGGVLAVVCTLSVVLQRRLVSAPLTATDTDDLIVADVVLVRALRDLHWVTAAAATTATVLLMFVPDFSWQVLGAFVVISAIVSVLELSNRKRHDLAPVARQLSAASSRP